MPDEPDRLSAPNQQVVRPDGSGPADEGEGGSASSESKQQDKAADTGAQKEPDTPTKSETSTERFGKVQQGGGQTGGESSATRPTRDR